MPILPARPSIEQPKKQAKRLHRAARSKNVDAIAHDGPYFGEPSEISLQQAQLVIARDYDFSSWAKLKHHVENGGGAAETTEQLSNRFLDFVCLHYGPNTGRGSEMFEQAADLLGAHPEIARHSLHAAAAAGNVDMLSELIAESPLDVDQKGGPFLWTPLMYAAYARRPGVSSYQAGLVLLKAGADPNAHHMWGGTYRFTVLTGIFGDGEGGKASVPEHPEMIPFARAVLDAGANPNDCQGAYNRCFSPDDTLLELVLEYGLKDSDRSDWWQSDESQELSEHRTMHFQLIMALRWGFADRARLLIENGVDLESTDKNYYSNDPVGYTPYQVALMRGLPEIAELIKAKGGRSDPLERADQFYAACMAGDLEAARALTQEYLGHSPDKDAQILREAAENGNLGAVKTMIEVGFDLNPKEA